MDQNKSRSSGMVSEDRRPWLLTRPWGFELSDVQGPVDFYTGDRDSSVPVQHVVSQAVGVANSSLTVWPKSGHMAVVSHLPDLLAALRPE